MSLLVSTRELRDHLNDTNWVIFDCRHDLFDYGRGLRLYEEGRIAGAHFVPIETALAGHKTGTNGRHPLPDPFAFGLFLAEHGVTPETQIVAYDDVGGQYAARLWWLARWIGLTRVAVLDGGFGKWVAEGGPLTTETTPRRHGNVTARPNPALIAATPEILAGITHGGLVVLDARAPERFRGETEPIDKAAGHIPTARNRFFKANLNPDLTFRPAAELRTEFAALLGSHRTADVVHQCGSGVTACVNLLAMEHAGLTGSRLYVGSWSEWSSAADRPVAKGA